MNKVKNKDRLIAPAFQQLPLGTIRPGGWLLNQLRIQADGLSGHLDEFWPDIAESRWIGGTTEGWERGPYWLDGIVPLAFLLNDKRLKGKVERWMDYILNHQQEDGWLGLIQNTSKGNKCQPYDPWPIFVALKAMTQYQEATGDKRVIVAMQRFFHKLDDLLNEKPLFDWGKSRWADLVLSIQWVYEHTGEHWLLDLATKIHEQGYDWRTHFAKFHYKQSSSWRFGSGSLGMRMTAMLFSRLLKCLIPTTGRRQEFLRAMNTTRGKILRRARSCVL
jgi:hypothetical protein